MRKKRVLYFYTKPSSFVKKDIDIISKQYEIFFFSFHAFRKPLTPFVFISELIFIIKNILSSAILICQFGGYHSFLPALFSKLLRKPCLIITGGTDCVSFPSINYGNFNKRLLGLFTRWSYSLATHISPVHESLMLTEYTYTNNDFPKQGLLAFCPHIKTPYTTIYNGYDSSFWYRKKEKVPKRFITVAAGIEMPFTLRLKGIDLILKVASRFPDCEFIIIGVPEAFHLNENSSNVKKIPFIKNELLPDYYSEAQFYLQLSMSEGFPNALCEAMLCECIPIVSNVGAMPFIVDDCGFILNRKNTNDLADIINKALISDRELLGKKSRLQISNNFKIKSRSDCLLKLIHHLIS